ncbi:TetR/AcrR family transcriptional regulator [Nocardioides cavernaquae]|uniref:TetR family transcriptional regulator n=1 Tax=Nocardioides cavernaquae TaxID=2321396 RepID=A0A3A5H7G0_9ACTN|nr:TetR/AcrR family transcriptional regulator [Nocardioides cavernaquae]RJS46609.1 TetR family transcriptional regulator [Nocardioides cavernaquae]
MPQVKTSARDRLVTAAFELFEEHGYDGATVEEIAQRAGVGRSTFFRTFGSKEDVIFPDHEAILARIKERLTTSAPETRLLAVAEGARVVLQHYLDEGEVARARYRLTSTVPALKAREISGLRAYQRLFTQLLSDWWSDEPNGALRAELTAAGVVTAHNHVLRTWLRGGTDTPERDLDEAMALVLDNQRPQTGETVETGETAVVVIGASGGIEAVAERVRAALAGTPPAPG